MKTDNKSSPPSHRIPPEDELRNENQLLEVKNLSISFEENEQITAVVNDISFTLFKSKLTAIVGESGSGKSLTALSLLQILPVQAMISGELIFHNDGAAINLAKASAKEIREIRGNRISMIFQEPMTSLNPVFTCGYQVMESLLTHTNLNRKQARKRAIELFEQVDLPDPAGMLKRYPHQVSGGQKQRVMIAMAMSCNPTLLIADEPTTALDVRVQQNILQLIKKLQLQQQLSVLFITHDLGLVAAFADEVLVMKKGKIVEQGSAKEVLLNPKHAYTKALLACRPVKESKVKKLPIIEDFIKNGISNISLNQDLIIHEQAKETNEPLLKVQNLKVYFPAKKNILGKTTSYYKAVDDVSFTVNENEIIGLVGESGCGKTTLGRAILQLVKPHSGEIILHGKELQSMGKNQLRQIRKDLQIVFQDPYGSLNPRITIGAAIMEPMLVHSIFKNAKERKEGVQQLLQQVNIHPDMYDRYPHQFSGGQRQRICIARALALEPSFIIFDESVSALDVSVQAQVLNLINDLKNIHKFTSIFISHDLSVVHYISQRILVMKNGKIIEEGSAHDIMHHPRETYTQQLIDAIP
jgi:peptide/nickel transport system ATP-binding protein